jgi:hypothetical protein
VRSRQGNQAKGIQRREGGWQSFSKPYQLLSAVIPTILKTFNLDFQHKLCTMTMKR